MEDYYLMPISTRKSTLSHWVENFYCAILMLFIFSLYLQYVFFIYCIIAINLKLLQTTAMNTNIAELVMNW